MRIGLVPLALATLVAFASPLAAVGADETPLHAFSGLSASRDGTFLADVESTEPADVTQEPEPHLIVRDFGGANRREIPTPCAGVAGCTISAPVWSPSSHDIAYVVHRPKAKERELYTAAIGPAPSAIAPRRVVSFAGTLGSPKFSSDGKAIALLAIPGARKEVGATQAGAAIVGEIGTNVDEQRIAIVPLDGSAMTYASPPDLFVYEFDWIPGGGFVGTAAHGDGDDNWWIAHLYRFDGGAATELYTPASAQMQIASPRVSRDGAFVAFVGGIMSDFGSTGGDLYALDLKTPNAKPVDLTPNANASVTSLAWLCRDDEVLFTQLHGDASEVALVPARAAGNPPLVVTSDAMTLSAAGGGITAACEVPVESLLPTNHPIFEVRMASVTQTFERAPEIATAEFGVARRATWSAITHENAALAPEAHARSVAWKSDSFDVQGWLLTPPHAPAGKRPMITLVHGGPAAANVPRFIGRGSTRDLLRRGYDVFFPNPRGSFGQGEAFALANVKDFGYGDLRDILAGIDAAEKVAPIDDARLGIGGGSYGGFMTMWAVTQTHRFKAAVAGAGIANWISYYGENGIDEWMIPYFGASAYDDPAVYRKSSPIEFIKNVTTPTFAYVGERDVECPAPQSQEFRHALDALGVPTSLVIYEGEGHHIASAAHIADVAKRTLAWYDRYLEPAK